MISTLLLLVLATSQPQPDSAATRPSDVSPQQDAKKTKKRSRPARRDDGESNADAVDSKQWWVQQLRQKPAYLALFSEQTLTYSAQGMSDRMFSYRLAVPAVAGSEDVRPLLVWLHDKTEAGDDNVTQLRHLDTLVFSPPWEKARYPFFLLAVQCPTDQPLWSAKFDQGDDMLQVLLAIIDQTIHDYPVDSSRVSLAGVGSGGTGCWELAMRRPEMFSGIVVIDSNTPDAMRTGQLVTIPIWAFHSTTGPATISDGIRKAIAALQAAGGKAHLTESTPPQQNWWLSAFDDYQVLTWLLSQKRGDSTSPPPATISLQGYILLARRYLTTEWTPGQLAGQIGIPLILILSIWSARRQRRRSSRLPARRLPAP